MEMHPILVAEKVAVVAEKVADYTVQNETGNNKND